MGEFREEVASRYSVPASSVSFYDVEGGLPGVPISDDTPVDAMDKEFRVLILENSTGLRKEWTFWLDRGGQKKGISELAYMSTETPEIAASMSPPSVVDVAVTDATGTAVATIPVASGVAGEMPSIAVSKFTPGSSPVTEVLTFAQIGKLIEQGAGGAGAGGAEGAAQGLSEMEAFGGAGAGRLPSPPPGGGGMGMGAGSGSGSGSGSHAVKRSRSQSAEREGAASASSSSSAGHLTRAQEAAIAATEPGHIAKEIHQMFHNVHPGKTVV
jgi:hypothetical protein